MPQEDFQAFPLPGATEEEENPVKALFKGRSYANSGFASQAVEAEKKYPQEQNPLTSLLQGFIGTVDKVTEVERQAYNFVPELMGLPEPIPKGSKEETIAIEANRSAAMITATAAMGALTRGQSVKTTGPATAAQITRSAKLLGDIAGQGGLKSQLLTFGAKTGIPAGISAFFGGPESKESAGIELGATIGSQLGAYAAAVSAAPAPAKPFAMLMGYLGKHPNTTKALAMTTGAAAGAFAGAGDSWEENSLKIGMVVGLPGVFNLHQGQQADKLRADYFSSGKDPFQRAVEDSSSQAGAAARLAQRLKGIQEGVASSPSEAARIQYVKTFGEEDAHYIRVMNKLNPVRAGQAFFSAELLNDPKTMKALVAATGGEEGEIGRALAHRTQDQISMLFGYDLTEEAEQGLQRLLPMLSRNADEPTKRLLSDTGLMDFPVDSPAVARNMAQALSLQEGMTRTIARVTSMSPADFAEMMYGLEEASKKTIRQEAIATAKELVGTGYPSAARKGTGKLESEIARLTAEGYERQVAPVLGSLKDEYLRRNIIGSAAKPVTHAAGAAADNADSLTKGEWIFDGVKMYENVINNKGAITSLYGEKGFNGVRDVAALVAFHQRDQAAEHVEGVVKGAAKSVSFMTHRLLFQFTTGQLTAQRGSGLAGMLLGIGSLQAGAEATAYGISLTRLSKYAMVEPEQVKKLLDATIRGDEIQEQAFARIIIGRLTGDQTEPTEEEY